MFFRRSMTVLEILETLEPTPDLVDSLPQAESPRASGWRWTISSGSRSSSRWWSWPTTSRWIFSDRPQRSGRAAASGCAAVTVALVAEKVETQEEYQQACEEGFTLFQGYYFCRPALLKNRKIPANRLSQIEILQHLRGDAIDLHKTEPTW